MGLEGLDVLLWYVGSGGRRGHSSEGLEFEERWNDGIVSEKGGVGLYECDGGGGACCVSM